MADNLEKERWTRRGFLGASSAALAAGMLANDVAGQGQDPLQKTKDRSRSEPVPKNAALDAQNPDSVNPPASDAGGVQTFKYPFSIAHKRLHEGGWSREVTVRELAVAKTLAGVNMRLTAGGVRELHWHTAAEWAFMLYGMARITCIDSDGKSFVTDVKEGDLWYFPPGIPHSIQGLPPDGTEFLLVFDDGNFSEYETVLLSDWMAHTPRDVVAKNFVLPQTAFEKMPKRSEEHTSELQSLRHLVCRLLLEKKKKTSIQRLKIQDIGHVSVIRDQSQVHETARSNVPRANLSHAAQDESNADALLESVETSLK